jgi:hypothetical protein
MPSAFAVLSLITRSNFVGCITGISAELAPLRFYARLAVHAANARSMADLRAKAIVPACKSLTYWIMRLHSHQNGGPLFPFSRKNYRWRGSAKSSIHAA